MTKQIEGLPSLSHKIKSADRNELLDLLKQAKVSVGHWNGRRICIEGYKGQMTFSEVARRVEDHYQAALEPMQLRQEKYKKESVSSFDPMPVRGKGGSILNILILPFTAPLKALADTACRMATPLPEVSRDEEKKIAPVLAWRRDVDSAMASLFAGSQNELNRRASRSCFGSAASAWDSFLDWRSDWRNSHLQDETTFAQMKQNRESRT